VLSHFRLTKGVWPSLPSCEARLMPICSSELRVRLISYWHKRFIPCSNETLEMSTLKAGVFCSIFRVACAELCRSKELAPSRRCADTRRGPLRELSELGTA